MNIQRFFSCGAAALTLAGCALPAPGIAPKADDTYVITKVAAHGEASLADLKKEAVAEADRFCADRRELMHVIRTDETAPPYIFGQHPGISTTFRCAD